MNCRNSLEKNLDRIFSNLEMKVENIPFGKNDYVVLDASGETLGLLKLSMSGNFLEYFDDEFEEDLSEACFNVWDKTGMRVRCFYSPVLAGLL